MAVVRLHATSACSALDATPCSRSTRVPARGRKTVVQTYLKSEAKDYAPALEATAALIDGFESPYGMELLATVDWLLSREGVAPTVPAVRDGLLHWRGGPDSAARKDRLFDDRALSIALERLTPRCRRRSSPPPRWR